MSATHARACTSERACARRVRLIDGRVLTTRAKTHRVWPSVRANGRRLLYYMQYTHNETPCRIRINIGFPAMAIYGWRVRLPLSIYRVIWRQDRQTAITTTNDHVELMHAHTVPSQRIQRACICRPLAHIWPGYWPSTDRYNAYRSAMPCASSAGLLYNYTCMHNVTNN